ncbi:MAG: hypothetical protein AB8B63_14360 [Granulosicoccus sp.]
MNGSAVPGRAAAEAGRAGSEDPAPLAWAHSNAVGDLESITRR